MYIRLYVTIQDTSSARVFRRKIPSYVCKNPITAGDFKWIFARNSEGTELLPVTSYWSPMASEIYVIVSIQNTYVWIAPENKSKYTCSAAGHAVANQPSNP